MLKRFGVPVRALCHFKQGRQEPAYSRLVKLAAGLEMFLAIFDPPVEEKKPTKGE